MDPKEVEKGEKELGRNKRLKRKKDVRILCFIQTTRKERHLKKLKLLMSRENVRFKKVLKNEQEEK